MVIVECMKRYYIAIEVNPSMLRSSFSPAGFSVPICSSRRSYLDWQDAMAYALWFLVNGRVGSRSDGQYLEKDRSVRRLRQMTD